MLNSLIKGFATLGNETVNAKITGLAQHLPFGRGMQQNMQVNTTNVNYGQRNSYSNFNQDERGVFDSYRIDNDIDDLDDFANNTIGSFDYGNSSQGSYNIDNDLIEGIYENDTENRGGNRR